MFGIVFIDGNHSYEYVKKDLDCTSDLIKNNGIFCGDDLELQYEEVDDMVLRESKNLDVVFDKKNKTNYHPGVTLAIFDFFDKKVSSKEGFWYVKKENNNWKNIELSNTIYEIPTHLKEKL